MTRKYQNWGHPRETPPAQYEFSVTLRGPVDDVATIIDLLRDTLRKCEHRYLDVQLAHTVEDMTDVR